ncbi:hypothetical protein [Fluviispira sanaruensis]|uniref:Uncharacterized protein n=1 Tax=Fluviispira sanaruensis TaxID=2493639 RepID=A0A4P2VTB3_FLUSA|nr:hypothetical protein [Fluviispira sanaruensis]BBH52122.1 hypothetical protein JCM31447_314100 [Fluviispira sanaruensis]
MDKKKLEDNMRHELNKILLLCETELKNEDYIVKERFSRSDNEVLKYYFYFSLITRELMAKNIGVSCERQLRRYFEAPLSVLNNFDLCNKIASYLKISYIDFISRIVDDKKSELNYQSSLLEAIKQYDEKFSIAARRKLTKLILVILENKIDIDCFYESSIFMISKKQYKIESINRLKMFIGKYVS